MGVDVRGITADSRAVQPGYMFAALPGAKVDGRALYRRCGGARRGGRAGAGRHGLAAGRAAAADAVAHPAPRARLAKMAVELAGPDAGAAGWR